MGFKMGSPETHKTSTQYHEHERKREDIERKLRGMNDLDFVDHVEGLLELNDDPVYSIIIRTFIVPEMIRRLRNRVGVIDREDVPELIQKLQEWSEENIPCTCHSKWDQDLACTCGSGISYHCPKHCRKSN